MSDKEKLEKLNIIITELWDIFPKNTQEELTEALKLSCEEQMKGTTTFIEVMLNQELGEPFRRDAMKKPVKFAGINKGDMKPQKSLVN